MFSRIARIPDLPPLKPRKPKKGVPKKVKFRGEKKQLPKLKPPRRLGRV